MSIVAIVAGLCVALLHVYILVLEMVLWTRPLGLKTFRNTPEKAQATRVLAANQGLYNGFLAAGLFWGALAGPHRRAGLLPGLRGGGGLLRRLQRQSPHLLRAGVAGADCIGTAVVAGLKSLLLW